MDNSTSPLPELELDNLRAIKILGKGATGTVFLVHDKSCDPSARNPFALKVVEKSSVHRHTDRRARHEIAVLRRLRSQSSPFLPHLIGSSENEEFISWAIPFCPGGDLNVLRYRQNDGVFSPAVIRFYLAEIISALDHLHSQDIVYRDLKPENILVQESGHVTLTDFDLSRDLTPRTASSISTCTGGFGGSSRFYEQKNTKNTQKHYRRFASFINPKIENHAAKKVLKKTKTARVSPVSRRNIDDNKEQCSSYEPSHSFVGTEEYIAPEVLRGDGHEFAVDWWALGVLCYEMLYGKTPFKGKTRKDTFRNVLFAQPVFVGKSNALTDLIGKLLEKNPTRRLGYRRGACEIKEHEFFRGLRWDLLTEVLRPPFLLPRDAAEEVVAEGGIDICEYFRKLKVPPSPLWSPSRDNVSLTEF